MPDIPIRTAFDINATCTNKDLTGATVVKFKYKKPGPNGTTGEWPAVLTPPNKLFYAGQATDVTQVGNWTIVPYVEKDGKPWEGTKRVQNFINDAG
jgi:hypothetical protein